MKKIRIVLIASLVSMCAFNTILAQSSLGSIRDNTNAALPTSYNFKEYVYAEPNDQGTCLGNTNSTANLEGIFLAQTHRNSIDHPFYFLIGQRPALLQLAITGQGVAPDVTVEGIFEGASLGILCLAGPEELPNSIALDTPNFSDYFSVTLPKKWIRHGTSLQIAVGNVQRTLSPEELKIGPYTEMNLVMVNMDVLDYNTEPHFSPIFDRFLQEMASAIPASVVRFGTFPVTLRFPELVASNNTEQLVRLKGFDDILEMGITNEGNINSVAMNFISELHKSTGDFLSTVYFGNTLNLAPGGWGGGKSFVGPDFTDIFIHELGHALSLPHWEETLDANPNNEDNFFYPYSGEDGFAGGRGTIWNFKQDTYTFEDPFCSDQQSENTGLERSDAMQREIPCLPSGAAWDGFGNFSAYAMYRNLIGALPKAGTVAYRNQEVRYQLPFQDGYPTAHLENGKRRYIRGGNQVQHLYHDGLVQLPWEEQLDQEVYLIYGSAHKTQPQANIVYEPIPFRGNLTPIIDPTNPIIFNDLQNLKPEEAPNFYDQPRDITLRITYEDNTVLHAIVPFATPSETGDDFGIWRGDVSNFSLVVPGTKKPCRVEVFDRPFTVSDMGNDSAANINFPGNAVNAENFMDSARLLATFDCGILGEKPEEEPLEPSTTTAMYPNPFNTSLTVDTPVGNGERLSVFNIAGQMISQHALDTPSTMIPMGTLSSGLYIAVVQDETGRIKRTEKLIRE